MADSSPPMVVGIRHTSSATSTVMVMGLPAFITSTEKIEYGSSVTVASSRMMVRLTSRMVSASSLGVFWRLAPSTIEIMRSRKLSPGLAVTRTTIQSDSTRVPPVTDEKSPPDSRITGADSPVMALSSTEATPSMTSPSPGTISPASMRTMSPRRSAVAARDCTRSRRCLSSGLDSTLACTVVLMPRSDAACCLLRPSASASAKLANSTVNHSHTDTARMKPAGASAWPRSAMTHSRVVRMLPM